jgi:hypothetical protein
MRRGWSGWGEGMMANDRAQDYISIIEKAMIKAFRESDAWGNGVSEYADSWAILGMAQYLIGSGVEIPKDLVPAIKKLVNAEKKITTEWRNPKRRVAALDRFLALLDGKEVNQRELERDNEGLIDKFGKWYEKISRDKKRTSTSSRRKVHRKVS